MSNQVSEFTKLIDICRKKDRKRILYNASSDHAIELFKALLEEAKVDQLPVKITSGNLTAEFYNLLTDHAKAAMDSGTNIELAVLYPQENLLNNSFARVIDEHEKGTVYEAENKVKFPHFIVVGKDRYRLETDHKQAKAVACFEDTKLGNILNVLFEGITNDRENMKPLSSV